MKNRVQTLREEKNLTQTELAEKSGLSLRTIQRIEAGNVPKGFTLKALTEALDIEPVVLFHDTPSPSTSDFAKIINISALSFLMLPFGNILIPAILTHRTIDENAKVLGKEILGIQIIWTAVTSILMVACPFLQKQFALKIPLFLIVLAILMSVNVVIILKNGVSLNQRQGLAIRLKNNIL